MYTYIVIKVISASSFPLGSKGIFPFIVLIPETLVTIIGIVRRFLFTLSSTENSKGVSSFVSLYHYSNTYNRIRNYEMHPLDTVFPVVKLVTRVSWRESGHCVYRSIRDWHSRTLTASYSPRPTKPRGDKCHIYSDACRASSTLVSISMVTSISMFTL